MVDAERVPADSVQLQLLVVRGQAGDERAFAQLLDTFGARTLRYLRGLVGDAAEDVQQEVWLSVYRSLHTLADPGAFRTWLFSTTRRRALDELRRTKREAELFSEPDEGMDAVGAPVERDETFDSGDLERLMDGLPPPQREVLLLRYQNALSYSQIALVVGCPVGTVRTRLHHAKRKLKDLLHGSGS